MISREANMEVGVIGICFNSRINSVVFLILNENGSAAICLNLGVKRLDSL